MNFWKQVKSLKQNMLSWQWTSLSLLCDRPFPRFIKTTQIFPQKTHSSSHQITYREHVSISSLMSPPFHPMEKTLQILWRWLRLPIYRRTLIFSFKREFTKRSCTLKYHSRVSWGAAEVKLIRTAGGARCWARLQARSRQTRIKMDAFI